jgi:putative inorganic carbon (HCO3(-)) transporter
MRDAILLLLVLATIPFTLKRPIVGAMTFAVISLMHPQRLTYGFAFFFPFAMVVSGVTLVSLLVSREQKKLPFTPMVVMLLLFMVWVNFTSLFALQPERVDEPRDWLMKTLVMLVVTIMSVRTVNDVKGLLLAVAMALGFWGFKGGLWTIATGGHNGMLGPQGTFIGDNNTLALAMVTSVPLMMALAGIAPTKWTRRAAITLAVLTGLAAIGSYSRGALLGGTMMILFLWLKSGSKLKTGMLLLIAAPLVFVAMPDEWMGRMHSIDNYQEDASALGRINAWGFAINIANHFPFGGGFGVFSPQMFKLYAPDPNVYFVAHSIYFQVLGEHGYFGLFLFLMLFFVAWRTATRIKRQCGTNPDYAWASNLARMCQVSIIGYMTAGAFLAMAYYDLIYYVFALLICTEKVLFLLPQPDNTPPMRLPFLSRGKNKDKARGWRSAAASTARKPEPRILPD